MKVGDRNYQEPTGQQGCLRSKSLGGPNIMSLNGVERKMGAAWGGGRNLLATPRNLAALPLKFRKGQPLKNYACFAKR